MQRFLTFSERVGYGIGGAMFSIKEAAYAVFVLLFYTQVLGLSGTLTGAALFVAILFDCLSDPVIGAWSDSLHSRWGRRHPFMFLGCVPLGFGFIGLFAPPGAVADAPLLLFAWLLFFSIWIRTFLSMYTIPHLAMAAEMSSDYRERSSILGTRLFILFMSTVLIPALALTFLFNEVDGVDGRFDRDRYPIYGIASCLLAWVVGLSCLRATRRWSADNRDQRAPDQPGARLASHFRDFANTLTNRNFRSLLAFDISAQVSYGILIALNMLAFVYYWELDADDIALILALPSLVGVSLAMPAMNWLGRHLAKHKIMQLACALMIVDAAWLYLLRLTGWLPENGSGIVFWFIFLQMALWMFLFILRGIATQSVTADIADELDLERGRRQEGALFAASAFAQKIATAVGPLYAGVVLDLVGLQRGMLPGSVSQAALDGLAIAFVLGVTLPLCLAWVFGTRISMSEARLVEIQQELGARPRV